MALQMPWTDPAGRDSPNAYHRVEIAGSAERMRADVTIWHNRAARNDGREPIGRTFIEFRPDPASARNFIAQAYDALKTQGYASATDV